MALSGSPDPRVRAANDGPVRRERAFVLYWMTAARRARWNFALDRALHVARELGKPLVVLEALRCDHPWASARFQRFVLEGMRDNARDFAGSPVTYLPYAERTRGEGKGLLAALARHAALVVTDELPCFFLPRMLARAAAALDVRLEAVDSNGLLPLAVAERAFPTAYAFRRFLQKTLPEQLGRAPAADPLRGLELPRLATLPGTLTAWPMLDERTLADPGPLMAALPIDHAVGAVDVRGGARAGAEACALFVERKLARYDEQRNEPGLAATSGLSPYLHFGHVAAHQVFAEIAAREGWQRSSLATTASGKRAGWWGMSAAAEAYLDQLVTWRELGFVFCHHVAGYERFETLPDWAQATLNEHARDARAHVYELADFEAARTHDELWNAAQRELRREGRIHNYLRMLWGKKILEWTRSPREALAIAIELNNKYALDGRDPNSYSGILWCFGRFDRPWGPVRSVFGTVRFMSSANTARKLDVAGYLARHGERNLFDDARA